MLRMTRMRIRAHLICGVILIAGFALRASPLQDPKRSVNSQTVDLTPLFHWWAKKEGQRPLGAWVHVTGPVVGTNAMGWTLEASVETSATSAEGGNGAAKEHTRIILKHPPARQFAEFERLTAQLKDLEDQLSKLSAQQADADKRADSAAKHASSRNGLRGEAYFQQEQQWNQTSSQAKDQIKDLDKQIQDVRARLAADSDSAKYSVDTFALDLHQKYDGLPVYDRGFVSR